ARARGERGARGRALRWPAPPPPRPPPHRGRRLQRRARFPELAGRGSGRGGRRAVRGPGVRRRRAGQGRSGELVPARGDAGDRGPALDGPLVAGAAGELPRRARRRPLALRAELRTAGRGVPGVARARSPPQARRGRRAGAPRLLSGGSPLELELEAALEELRRAAHAEPIELADPVGEL